MHSVRQQHVRPEHAEPVEMDERTATGAGEVADGVATVRRDVEREADPAVAGQLARAGDQLVAHQVVPDERDPALDEAAGRQPVEQVAVPREHLGGRGAEGHVVDVPSPLPIVARIPTVATAAATRSGWATVPASTVHVTPLVTASIAPRVADSSSSSPVWAAWTGTAQPKIASCESMASGMHECTSRSPVRCWWAFTYPGVTSESASPITRARGAGPAARSHGPDRDDDIAAHGDRAIG